MSSNSGKGKESTEMSVIGNIEDNQVPQSSVNRSKKLKSLGFIAIACGVLFIIALFLSITNLRTDPCKNFYQFACHNWEQDNPRPAYLSPAVEWNAFTKLESRINTGVEDLLRDLSIKSSDVHPDSALGKANFFFTTCVQSVVPSDQEKNSSLDAFWKTLENHGGWPVLYEPGSWNVSRFNFTKSMAGLIGNFSTPFLFDVKVDQSWLNVSENKIVLKPSQPIIYPEVQLANFFKSVGLELLDFQGKTNIATSVFKEQANELIRMGHLFHRGHTSSIGDWLLENGYKHIGEDNNMTISEYQEMLDKYISPNVNHFDLLTLLRLLFENTGVTISKTDRIYVENIWSQLKFAKQLSSLKVEDLANFIQFEIAAQLAPISTPEMLVYWTNWQNAMLQKSSQISREQYCARITQQKLPRIVELTYMQRNLSTNWNKVQEIFRAVKTEFRELIRSSKLPYINVTTLIENLDGIDLYSGCPPWALERDAVDADYADLVLNQSSFLEQYMVLNSWKVTSDLKMLRLAFNLTRWQCEQMGFISKAGAYFDTDNRVVYLPLAQLEPPFFSVEYSEATNYGKLGTILGHEIAHSLGSNGILNFENGSLTPCGECLSKQQFFGFKNFRDHTKPDNPTFVEMMADNAGLVAGYKSFQATAACNGNPMCEDKRMLQSAPGSYSGDQLFFLGFAQNLCESTNEHSNWIRRTRKDPHPVAEARVFGTLQNSREFAKAWNCPVGSDMNPEPKVHAKCEFF